MNKLEPGSYSTGTMLESDLLGMFRTIAETIGCQKCDALVTQGNVSFDQENYEDTQWILNDLADHVEEAHVPEGYRFGAHEGDGADFGVWEIDQ